MEDGSRNDREVDVEEEEEDGEDGKEHDEAIGTEERIKEKLSVMKVSGFLSNYSEKTLRSVRRGELLVNMIPLDFSLRNEPVWIYYIIYPERVVTYNQKMFSYHRAREALQRDHIEVRSGVVITRKFVISTQKLGLKDVEFPIRGLEEFGLMRFEEEVFLFDGSNLKEEENILHNTIRQILIDDDEFKRNWRIRESVSGKEVFSSSEFESSTMEVSLLSKNIEDKYLEKQIYACVRVKTIKREGGWFIVITPGSRIQKKYPNCLELINEFQSLGFPLEEKQKIFRKFKIHQLAYRRISSEYVIKRIRFDLKAGHRMVLNLSSSSETENNIISSNKDTSNLSFIQFYFKKYSRALEKRGIVIENVLSNQPMLEVEVKNNNKKNNKGKGEEEEVSKIDYLIPQLISVDCRVENEGEFMKDFVRLKLSMSTIEKLNLIEQWNHGILRNENVTTCLGHFKIRLKHHFWTCRHLKKVREVVLANNSDPKNIGKSFHTTRTGSFNWRKKKYEITTGGKADLLINFNGILLLCDKSISQFSERILDRLVETCERKRIEIDTEKILIALIDGRTFENYTKKYENDFGRLPKIVICVINEHEKKKYVSDFFSPLLTLCAEKGIIVHCVRGVFTFEKKRRIKKEIKVISSKIFRNIYCSLGGFLWNVRSLSTLGNKKSLVIGIVCSNNGKKYLANLGRKRYRHLRYPSVFCMVATVPTTCWTRRLVYLIPEKYDDKELKDLDSSLLYDRKEVFRVCSGGSGITIMKNGMELILRFFRKSFNNQNPNCFIIYREGDFLNSTSSKFTSNNNNNHFNRIEQIRKEEVDPIKTIVRKNESKLVFLLAKEENSIVFFNREGNNPPPGTFIDQGITFHHQESFLKELKIHNNKKNKGDFFLLSNENQRFINQNPVHYITIINELILEEEEEELIQKNEIVHLTSELSCLDFQNKRISNKPFVLLNADKLRKIIFKSIFKISGSIKNGFSLNLSLPFFSLASVIEKPGKEFSNVTNNQEVQVVRVLIHEIHQNGMFEFSLDGDCLLERPKQKMIRSCSVCGKKDEKMQKCGKCKIVFYCGRQCQIRDWNLHKIICK